MKTASVFDLARQPTPKKRVKASIDPDMLVIEHNVKAPTNARSRSEGKYDARFAQLKPGSAIRCERDEVAAISVALQKQLRSGRWPAIQGCVVRHMSRCDDGHARVYVIAK